MSTGRFAPFLLPLFLAPLAAVPAFADQCAVVDPAQAEKALPHLEQGTPIAHLCEPCGDKEPRVEKVENAEIAQWREDNTVEMVVKVNGAEIDAAYVFVPSKGTESRWHNLAKLIGCPTEDVSESIAPPGKGQKP